MATYQSAGEILAGHIAMMGEDLGARYHALWQEIALLHAKWREYVELYGTKPARIDLLNRSAPRFFRLVQDTLWEETLLSIARLTDPAESIKQRNLTIRALPSLVRDTMLQKQIEEKVDKALKAARFCRDARNRRLAHRDLGLALNPTITPLQPTNRALVIDSLKALSCVLNCLSRHYYNSETLFDYHDSSGGALSLIYVLDDGLKRAEERRLRITKQDYTSKDSNRRDL